MSDPSTLADEAPLSIGLENLGKTGDFGALAHYSDPSYYSLTYGTRCHDVEYYVRRARELGGPVLEYGCGNGRITLPLAKAGLSVVGVELSQPMLTDLQTRLSKGFPKHRERIELVRGDMREVRLARQFPLVIAPFNVLLHLYEPSDVLAFFARVREHLAPGGRFIFDVSVPQPEDLCRDPDERFEAPRFQHPDTGTWVGYSERFEYDPLRQLLLVWMEFTPEDGSEPWTIPLTHRQFFPRELELLLELGGLGDVRRFADFTDQAPDYDVDSMVIDCTRRA